MHGISRKNVLSLEIIGSSLMHRILISSLIFPLGYETFIFFGTWPRGQPTASYMVQYLTQHSQLKDGRIDINTIEWLDLKIIAFTVTILCGNMAPHVATKAQMKMDIECFEGTIFNWCEGVLVNMKGQLTRAKNGKLKNFGYGTILISFTLEWIPLLVPQQLLVDLMGSRDWCLLMGFVDGSPYWRWWSFGPIYTSVFHMDEKLNLHDWGLPLCNGGF